MSRSARVKTTAVTLVLLLLVNGSALAELRVLAVSGQPAPGGNGVFAGDSPSSVGTPSLSDSGVAAFSGLLTGTTGGALDNSGVFASDGVVITEFAREGQPAPGGGTFGLGSIGSGGAFIAPAITGAGQVTFVANTVIQGGATRVGIFQGKGSPIVLTEVVRVGAPSPDGDGTFAQVGFPAVSGKGQVSFAAQLTGTSVEFGLYLGGKGGTLTQLARSSEPAPDGAGPFTRLGAPQAPALNEAGQVAFFDSLGAGTAVAAGGAILRTEEGVHTLIARDGLTVTTGKAGTFGPNPNLVAPIMINDAGQVGFTFKGLAPGAFSSVYLTQGSALTEVIRTGEEVPGTGQLLTGVIGVGLNNADQVVFVGTLAQTGRGIFRTNGKAGGVRTIALQSQATPDGRGVFGSLGGSPEGYDVSLNDAGQLAFFSPVTGSSSSSGLFFHDDRRGLLQVARVGDPLLNSTITELRFRGARIGEGAALAFLGKGYGGLNALGQVAFAFSLADGRKGAAIWTPPAAEPLDDFVAGFYRNLLDRTPPQAEVDAWAAFLRANCTPDGIRVFAGGFLHSDEYIARPTTVDARIDTLYDTFLGRPGDPAGQAGWRGAFVEAYHSLLPGFVGSAEFQSLIARTPREEFVERLYQNILARQSAPAETQAWGDYLQATNDYSGVARGFFGSPEYLARPLSLPQHVDILYATFLDRAPDAAGSAGWVNFLSGQLDSIYDGFIDSQEFQGRIALCP